MLTTVRTADTLQRFLRQAEATPDAPAVADGTTRLTYRELAETGAAVAAELAAAGVAPGSLVGLSVTRGWRAIAGMIGIWRHGCAYVPVDPAYPQRRRAYIAADAGFSHLIVDGGAGLAVEAAANPKAQQLPANLAYVIYTSGSTGDPKGVLVRHDNIEALLRSAEDLLPAGPGDAATVFHSYCFDFSVWEIWRPLTTGGQCVLVPTAVSADADSFAQLLARERITLLSLVPSVFANLVGALRADPVALPDLREVVFGGEAIDLNVIKDWYRLGVAPNARLINMYGITETTVHVTVRPLDPAGVDAFTGSGTPIGVPLPHLTVAVLDDDGRPVPPGRSGEMYVSGGGVSSGYLGRPDLTAQRFGTHPEVGPGIWYRTGDLARRDPDGELVYLGRRDAQVQLRGFRVELGEIEAALTELPEVAGAGTVVAPNRQGEPVLVAYYVPAVPDLSPGRLRAALGERLPGYMVPGRFVPVDRLPVTPEGKLDRKALAAIGEAR